MLRVREIHRDAEQTVSVIEAVESGQSRSGKYCHCWGSIKPLAVIVRRAGCEYAVDINAKPIDAEHLSQMLDSQHIREASPG